MDSWLGLVAVSSVRYRFLDPGCRPDGVHAMRWTWLVLSLTLSYLLGPGFWVCTGSLVLMIGSLVLRARTCDLPGFVGLVLGLF